MALTRSDVLRYCTDVGVQRRNSVVLTLSSEGLELRLRSNDIDTPVRGGDRAISLQWREFSSQLAAWPVPALMTAALLSSAGAPAARASAAAAMVVMQQRRRWRP